MTQEEMKVVITAETSKFSKAINNIKNSIKGISTSNVGKGFDSATASVGNFEAQFSKAMENVNRTTKRTSEQVRQKWLAEMDRLIGVTRLKLAQMSQNFEKSGYTSDYWAEQIDSGDAYLRKLEQFRKAFAEGMVDVPEVQGFEHFSEEVENALSSIEKMDLQMEATINLETGDLKSAEGSLQAIKLCLEQIKKLKADPLDREAILKIKQYRKQIDALASSWAKANKVATANKYNELLSQYPDLYARIQQSTQNLQTSKKSKNNSPDFGKMAGTITRALIGVRSLFFFVRKIAAQNDFLQFAVQAMFETIAGALKPLLDFIARVILGLAKIIGRIFGVAVGVSGSASATADNTGKMVTIASFDELETLNKAMSGGSGEGGVDGGYDSLLKKIDEKLGWIYKLIDKVKQFIKDNMPGGKNVTETGVPRVTEQASQEMYGVSSLGFNLVPDGNGGFINLKEIEDNVEKARARLESLKQFWADLKEVIKNNNQQIIDDSLNTTDRQVEHWQNFKENVATKWEELKTRWRENAEQRSIVEEQNIQDQIQMWETFKQNVSQKWTDLKTNISERWDEIKNNISQKWEEIKTKINTGWESIKTKAKESVENIKSFFTGIPSALRNAMNSVITWVETGINNIINKINNSGIMTVLNRAFGGGLWINPIWIPRLANGGVLTTPTVAQLGEYPGAHNNPEIAAPESLLTDIFHNENGQLASVFAQGIRQVIQAIDQKDLDVIIGDTTIAKSAARGNRSYQLATGQSLF